MMADETKKKTRQMDGTITTLSFRKTNAQDQELIVHANAFVNLPENRGIPATSVLRNFILRKLQEAIDAGKNQRLAAG